ncbi:MAG TPA: nitroreductase family deazaflavin-dependent oxidoreductase [Nocardioides sp.]|nr:nitroreductase family deazaflavin-dependent oxidoreductase [Nocardioides sp.]
MSIADALGYEVMSPNLVQRAMRRVASTRMGARVLSSTMRHIDDVVQRASGGRTTSAAIIAGLAVLDVTTTGRRSGQPRTSHLVAVPYDGALAVLGTNFGGASTPAWVHNVKADPHVTVTYRGTTVAAIARPATPEEQAGVLAASEGVYLGYRKYQERITGRTLRIFLLQLP